MVNQPIKLQDNLSLYSGDVITINNSNHLLVEVISEQVIKLREIKSDKYLSKSKMRNPLPNARKSLSFSAKFEKALIFTVKSNNNGKISLHTDNKYLDLDSENDDKFYLLTEEKWLTIAKKEFDSKEIFVYEETVDNVDRHDKKLEKSEPKELSIASDFHDNKSENPLEINCTFSESIQETHTITWSTDLTLGSSVKLKLSPSFVGSIGGIGIEGKYEKKTSDSNTNTENSTRIIQKNIKSICSPWKKMKVELKAKRSEYSIPYIAKVKRTIGERTYEYSINGKYVYDNYYDFDCTCEEITVKNILIVGWTGSGKSTLSNVLSENNEFLVSGKSISGTKVGKISKEFKWQDNHYCVIDNIGFGDIKVNEKETLIRIGEAINSAYQGLSDVLFVFDGRFSKKETESLHKLVALKIANRHVTLVRSKFDNFGNEKECEEDKKKLEKESPEVNKLIDNCRGLLHINNEDEDSQSDSREVILNHLHNNCSNIFKPKEWENITSLIEDYFKEKENLEKIKEQVSVKNKEKIEQQLDKLKTDTAEQVKEKIQGNNMKEFIELIQVKAKGTK